MTYLQLVNAVLTRLREDEVSSVSDTTYSKLIGQFVNQAKNEIERAWPWSMLKTEVPITTSAGTDTYDFNGTFNKIISVVNDTDDGDLYPMDSAFYHRNKYIGSTTNASPDYYIFEGVNGTNRQVKFWPTPDATYVIRFKTVTPQATLSSDSTELTIPSYPVELRAWALAISERGEDGGQGFSEIDMDARSALADEISFDALGASSDITWVPV